MARKSKEAEKAYQAEYYKKRMASKEAREEKNAKQREYAKKTGYKSTSKESKQKYNEKTYDRFVLRLRNDKDQNLIDYIENEKSNGNSPTSVIKSLILKNMK